MNAELTDDNSSEGEYSENEYENEEFGDNKVENKPYDEQISVGSDDSVTTEEDDPMHGSMLSPTMDNTPTNLETSLDNTSAMNASGTMLGDDDTDSDDEDDMVGRQDDDDDEGGESGDESDGSESSVDQILEYNPDEYNYLNVSRDIVQLFSMIKAYKPHHIELDSRLKPFIPDYISSVGEVDPFLKVPRPDGKPDNLGLVVLDEPRAEQSDPTVIKMVMDQMLTHVHAPKVNVRSIQKKDSVFPKQIQKWIDNIEQLHKRKPPQTVTHTSPMPEIETLMQYWSPEYEEAMSRLDLPSASLDLSTEEYAKILCALLDIPVNNVIESLHTMFSLYQTFRSNSHYNRSGN